MMDETEHVELTNDYMFGYVMRHPNICRSVIQCLLPDVAVADVRYRDVEEIVPETQKTIQGSLSAHSVRLDVYLDDGKTIYNVEMQTGSKMNLPKRVRYYGGRIDCDQLEKSEDYNLLRPTYVIFICTFDPFGQGQYHYSFENTCAEVEGLRLGDQSYKLFFNAAGRKGNISSELKALLDYMLDPRNMPESQRTGLIKEIDGLVEFANQDAEWRRGFMTYRQMQLDARNEGRAEGMAEGMAKGITEGKIEGENLMAKLAALLASDGKTDDIIRAACDESYRSLLFREYRLT